MWTEAPKIMVIDDDPFQIQLIESILVAEGHRVVGLADSRLALEQVKKELPDLVLTDLIMPEMDGFEVIRALKADSATRHIPIVLVTAKKDQRTEFKGLDLGAVDYITKPLAPPIVKARVRAHLELKRHRDMLERLIRQQNTELDSSRQQFKDLVEKSLVGTAIVQQGCVVYSNPELKRIMCDFDGKLSARDFSFVHPDDLPKMRQAYENLAVHMTPYVEADVRLMLPSRKTGAIEVTWVNCRAAIFNYQDGESILVNAVDITPTKELEKLLLIRNKMASLGRIASGMAHEIRNPLTGITSYLYTLEQLCELTTLLPKDLALMKEIISQLKLASHKVDAVIKRVLDFARPATPQMVRINLNTCIQNVLHLTAVTLRKAGVQVSAATAADLPFCYGDMALIEQVLLNLIQNASHALQQCAQGARRIEVASFARQQEICITVADSGSGVPTDLKEKIFDPFFTTSPEGSGIGLSIAQRIVSDHNGSLVVATSHIGGALFTIAIPIEKRKMMP